MHDWLTGFRGGERVLEALCEMFPNAPIYTLLHKKGSTSPIIESKEIVTSFLDRIPNIHESYRSFLPLMPLAAQNLKIQHEADIIISSSHCVIKGVPRPKGSKHLCYIHSPMRYIYDQFDSYFGHKSLPVRIAAHTVRPYLQLWDRNSNHNVDMFVANSRFVAQRLNLFYGIKPEIVHPFVDLKDFREIQNDPLTKDNYFLMVTAFAPNKRVDLALEAFKNLGAGYNLKIVGSGSDEETQYLKLRATSNVEFLGNIGRSEIVEKLAKAQALIFPGIEDFGITPLESLASGTPVIAYKAAGVLDSLTDQTAHFFMEQNSESLTQAIKSFKTRNYNFEKLRHRAENFSKENFVKNISDLIKRL